MTTAVPVSPRLSPPRAAWRDLDEELDAWADSGIAATFWWRDDDATTATPALARLAGLSRTLAVPLALAVIPAQAQPDLAAALNRHPTVTVLQHGWSHVDHAAPPAKKCELGSERAADTVLAELAEGRRRLERLFGPRALPAALPVLVPPWNRIAPAVAERLGEAGIHGLSTFGPRRLTHPGVACVNTHLDPIAWKEGKRFLGEAESLGMAVAHLRARRAGSVDTREPTGLLTHHLVMDDETWAFAERFLSTVRSHPAARWLPPDALFGSGPFEAEKGAR